jgi:two-component system sensor histidine kinase KdpD
MARGKLRIYLGAAPGVGKTYAMLEEGQRRRERGTDVVAGLVVTYDRPKTMARLAGLEVVPPKRSLQGDDHLVRELDVEAAQELDVEAVLARRPQVALVDELAHSNSVGSRNAKRWQDIERLLDAGIEVISTVNIEHLESVNDVVHQITGVAQSETVPDAVVRQADQIELVDMSPEALRRRLAHGNIWPAEQVDAALGNYFRVGNLAALRELALLWVADRVEDSLQAYLADRGIKTAWETRERVVVALTGAPDSDHLIRRAARMAQRTRGDLLGVNVIDEGLARRTSDRLVHARALLEELGGTYHQVAGTEIAEALVLFATAQHATQLVLGTSRRSRWTEMTRGSVINEVIRKASHIDVHVISTEAPERSRSARVPKLRVHFGHTRDRILVGLVIAAVALPPLTFLVAHESYLRAPNRGSVTSGAGFLIYLGVVVVIAAVGGLIPALVAAVVAAAAVDYYLIPPYGSFAIARGSDAGYLAAFVVCAGVVSVVVEQAARRRVRALRARDEADAVLALADRLARPNPPQAVAEEIRVTLSRQSVTLLRPEADNWIVEGSAGEPVASSPADGEAYVLPDQRVLVMTGDPLPVEQHRLVSALLSYLEAVVAIFHLQSQASVAEELSQANDLRTALLAAVSHDLRTPLASIKALATGLLEPDVRWSEEDTHEFLVTIDTETDRLNKLVDNLLDMSRLQTGALHLSVRPVGLDEVVPAALASLSRESQLVTVEVPETLPRVLVDPALLERAVANVIDNAIRHSSDSCRVRVNAGEVAGRVDLRIVDRGSGIPLAERARLFQPFQRLGDTDSETGVGLGLAVSHGFVEAMGGELTVEDTPGGGITMVIRLLAAPGDEALTDRAPETPLGLETVHPA